MSVAEPQPERGDALLLVHCAAVPGERPSAYTRLVDALGGDLARLLLFALSGSHGRRGSSSP
ncbi:MAG TPA: hypothetical protein VGC78_04260 [Gaiellaceae bacterium]|jgi:hypothetical protein